MSKSHRVPARNDLLQFRHRKLTKMARDYQHEIYHLTTDLNEIKRRIHETLAMCKFTHSCLASPEKHVRARVQYFQNFNDLLYHLENFIFRLHAYQDKLCMFVNFSMRIGYTDREMQLRDKLIRNENVKKQRIDTELNKFLKSEISSMLRRRKAMSHRVYYNPKSYSNLLDPGVDPKKEGVKKAVREWSKKIRGEVTNADKCLLKVYDINTNIANKIKSFLDVSSS